MPIIEVNHNVEMGHRLSLQPDSKCFHLHGHSWRVYLRISGPMDPISGMVMDFTPVKQKWRSWLDDNFDHHLLLNPNDPLLALLPEPHQQGMQDWGIVTTDRFHPDHRAVDPTVENFAALNYWFAKKTFNEYGMFRFHVKVFEAASNAAEYGDCI